MSCILLPLSFYFLFKLGQIKTINILLNLRHTAIQS